MRLLLSFAILCCSLILSAQVSTPDGLRIELDTIHVPNNFFNHNDFWLGGDAAASIDLGNNRVLWLFGDSFIGLDTSRTRQHATIIRNSIAIQDSYDPLNNHIEFYYRKQGAKRSAFFADSKKHWLWPGHGTMIRDKLLIFFLQEKSTKRGLGFKATGWTAALISNPQADPEAWKIQYLKAPETFGLMAGSGAVLRDDRYVYAFGTVEPDSHEVYLLRWPIAEIYHGNIKNQEWWIESAWKKRLQYKPRPAPLFTGTTEFSVHYDPILKKYLQFQAFGFGDASIGIRTASRMEGPWSDPTIFYKPDWPAAKQKLIYSVKAHPELGGIPLLITFNVNSFDFAELLRNPLIYYPQFIRVRLY